MENIHILSSESFAKYKSKIGLILFNDPEQKDVNFFTGKKHYKIKRNELKELLLSDLKEELNDNDELKELAYDNDLIEIYDQDTAASYHAYISAYN